MTGIASIMSVHYRIGSVIMSQSQSMADLMQSNLIEIAVGCIIEGYLSRNELGFPIGLSDASSQTHPPYDVISIMEICLGWNKIDVPSPFVQCINEQRFMSVIE